MNVDEKEWAKVNVEFPGLEMIDSCEASDWSQPVVCFRFGRYWETQEPWRDIAEFAQRRHQETYHPQLLAPFSLHPLLTIL